MAVSIIIHLFLTTSCSAGLDGETYMASIDTDGDAGLLLDFLRHLDGVVVRLSMEFERWSSSLAIEGVCIGENYNQFRCGLRSRDSWHHVIPLHKVFGRTIPLRATKD